MLQQKTKVMTEGTEKKGKGGVVKHVLIIASAVAVGMLAAEGIKFGVRALWGKMRGSSNV